MRTEFDGVVPNIYNANEKYKVKKYEDLQEKTETWYYPYLFKATNIGAIGGDDQGKVNAIDPVTRAELFKILLESADVELENANPNAEYWARNYIRYMTQNIDIYAGKAIDDSYFYSEIPRDESAYIIKSVFMGAVEDTKVPNKLYTYSENMSCDQMSNWNSNKGLSDKWKINQYYLEAVRQLYCNKIMVGDGNSFNPEDTITRAEMCKSIMSCLFTLYEGLKNVRVVKDGEKTVYIMLYDSDGVGSVNADTNISRYKNSDGSNYVYTQEFFEKYFELIGNKNVAFVISVRDVDFDGYMQNNGKVEQNNLGNLSKFWDSSSLYGETSNRLSIVVNKYKNILQNMQSALTAVNGNRADKIQMPEIYLGTPHMWRYEIDDATQRTDFLNLYLDTTQNIYNSIANEFGENIITGLYYGREDPICLESNVNTYTGYANMEQISRYIHGKDKKLIWIPYCDVDTEHWENIGTIANTGKCTDNSDIFDIVMIQPGLYFSDYNDDMAADEKMLYENKVENILKSSINNTVVDGDSVIGGIKNTNTIISFEMEYDISLVTGRVHGFDNNAKVYPKQKAQNFMRTLGKYYSLIYDDMTSYGIYSGGPNEQAYLTQTLNGTNNNIHNFINHPSVYGVYNDSSKTWSDSHDEFAYDQFISTFADNRYNIKDYGKLIYDITRGLLYNVWGENGDTRVKQYLGMQ